MASLHMFGCADLFRTQILQCKTVCADLCILYEAPDGRTKHIIWIANHYIVHMWGLLRLAPITCREFASLAHSLHLYVNNNNAPRVQTRVKECTIHDRHVHTGTHVNSTIAHSPHVHMLYPIHACTSMAKLINGLRNSIFRSLFCWTNQRMQEAQCRIFYLRKSHPENIFS